MKKHDRQSFLGIDSENILRNVKVGIVGLGGGGSHISQQVAHIGVGNVFIFDYDCVDEEGTNLNRLVGATESDVRDQTPKVNVAHRLISGIDSNIEIHLFKSSWQENHEALRECDVLFGCVDSLLQRRDLENAARRFLTPYIDIGMDVTEIGDSFSISGQVFLSMPGMPCMQCFGLLPESGLAQEAGQYGAAGSRPQVIWSNGILASAAVGLFMQLVTPWQKDPVPPLLLEYDGNAGTLTQSKKLRYLGEIRCEHYPLDEVGDPFIQ